MTKNEDLKACPWCNGKAYINNFKSQPCQLHGDRETMWRIQCKHKDAKWMDSSSLPECHVKPVVVASTREEAIERWNTRPTVTPTDGDAERVNAARKIVKEADDKSRQDKKLADAIQSIKWAMANTFVICTGATIEGVKHQVPDMREPLNLVLEAALQSTRKPPTKGE